MKKILLLLTALFVMGGVVAENATLNQLEAAYGSNSDWEKFIPATYPIDVTNAVVFGSDASSQVANANVNNYDYIYFEVTDFTSERALRVFFWDPYQNKRIDYYLKPVADKDDANYSAASNVSANGLYCVKIPDGARLQGSKAPWGSGEDVAFKISSIYLTERATPYVELVPYTLVYSDGQANIPISESHVRTTGDVSIDYATGEVTNTGSGTLVFYLNDENLIGASLYHVDFTGTNLEPVFLVTDAVNGVAGGGIYNSRFNWNIAGDASRNQKIGAVKSLTYEFTKTGTMTFTSIYIKANQLVAESVNKNLVDMPYGRWGAPASKISQYIDVDSYKTNNIGKENQSLVYGHDGVADANKYVDLTNCSKLIFTGLSSNGQIRLFYNWSGTDADKPIEVIADFPKTSGAYVFDIDAFKKAKGISFFHLNGIKAPQGGQVTISAITVDQYTNKISGSGIDRTKGLLANPYVKVIDATGVTGTNVALESANPNCIFLANAGTLSNTKNVQIGNTIENLEITDKKPLADLTGVTATDATYTRSMTNQFGTICLPYAVKSTASVKYYTIGDLDGNVLMLTEVAVLAAGTPAIVEKVSGESITATGSGALAAAGAPTDNLELIGTFEEKTVLAEDYAGKNIYAIKNNQFVQGLNSITVPAFRAYFTAAASAGANLRLAFGDEATAIDSLTGEKSIKAIYSVSGASQASLQKGMNIVEFTDGSVKKVMVK